MGTLTDAEIAIAAEIEAEMIASGSEMVVVCTKSNELSTPTICFDPFTGEGDERRATYTNPNKAYDAMTYFAEKYPEAEYAVWVTTTS